MIAVVESEEITVVDAEPQVHVVVVESPDKHVVTVGESGPPGAAGEQGPPGTGLEGLTPAAILFGDTDGDVAQDATNLVWDNTNKRLGLGTAAPAEALHVEGNVRLASAGSLLRGSTHYIHSPFSDDNTCVGVSAGNISLTSSNNTAVGYSAGNAITTSSGCTLVGAFAGLSITTSRDNTMVGYAAGRLLVAGSPPFVTAGRNTVIGASVAGSLVDGERNVIIGAAADVTTGSAVNRIAIGEGASADTNNHAVIGSSLITAWKAGSDGGCTLGTSARGWKGIYFDHTTTTVGTTGNQTINKPAGRVNIAAGGTAVTVTNNLVTADTLVLAWCMTNDATAYVKNVVPAAGSFAVNLGAAATAEVAIGFLVINTN